jgi:hypothetical protein
MQTGNLFEVRGSRSDTGANTYLLTPVGEQALAERISASY